MPLNNDWVNTRTYAVYANGPGPMKNQSISRSFACKNPDCERFACTASAERCSMFCCPGCFDGTGHTELCDNYFPGMKARLVPGLSMVMSDDLKNLDCEQGGFKDIITGPTFR